MKRNSSIFIKKFVKYAICVLLGMGFGFIFSWQIWETNQSAKMDTTDENDTIVSPEIYADLEQLDFLVGYAIQMYCEEENIENTYEYCLLEDILHHDTRIEAKNGRTYDLDKIISSNLINDRYTFRAIGDRKLLVVIDTYRMKMYVYDEDEVRIVGGETDREAEWREELGDYVQCDWPDDMWSEEYYAFVKNGWEYLATPSVDEMTLINADLYGMVIYSLQRYCTENGIEEQFWFEFPRDKVSTVTSRIFVVKVESENRVLYMDIDMDRNKVHVYEVDKL